MSPSRTPRPGVALARMQRAFFSLAIAVFVVFAWHRIGHAAPTSPDSASAEWTLKPPNVFGYVQVHYRLAFATGGDSIVDNDDFRVQRVRIGVKGDVSPRISYDVEIDPRAPEITGVLRDAFITARGIVPRHQLRVGQQKTQFGYENRVSSSDLYAVNRTEISDNLSRGINLRDIGIGLIGNIKLGQGVRLEDAITVVNGAGLNVQADDTPRKNVWGRVGVRWKGDADDFVARFGVSGGTGDLIDINEPDDPDDDFQLSFTRYGIDVEIDHPRFFVSTEFVSGSDKNLTEDEEDDPSGYYVNLVGKTARRVGPIVRYDTFGDEFKRWTFGAYYALPSEPFRLMVNYELRQIKDDTRGDDKLYVWTQVRY